MNDKFVKIFKPDENEKLIYRWGYQNLTTRVIQAMGN